MSRVLLESILRIARHGRSVDANHRHELRRIARQTIERLRLLKAEQ